MDLKTLCSSQDRAVRSKGLSARIGEEGFETKDLHTEDSEWQELPETNRKGKEKPSEKKGWSW